MSKDDYMITTSQSPANTVTHDNWLKINKKLERLSVNKEDLELLYKAITGESLRAFDSLNRSTSEALLNLYNEDDKAFDLKTILPIYR